MKPGIGGLFICRSCKGLFQEDLVPCPRCEERKNPFLPPSSSKEAREKGWVRSYCRTLGDRVKILPGGEKAYPAKGGGEMSPQYFIARKVIGIASSLWIYPEREVFPE